jgi:hypothetical protein
MLMAITTDNLKPHCCRMKHPTLQSIFAPFIKNAVTEVTVTGLIPFVNFT